MSNKPSQVPSTQVVSSVPMLDGDSSFPANPQIPQTLSLERFLNILKRKWWLLLLSMLGSGGLAAAYVVFWPMSYVSSAHLWVAGRMGLQLREGATYSEDAQNYAGTQVELIKSERIYLNALDRLDKQKFQIPTNSEGQLKLAKLTAIQIPKSAMLELKVKGPTPVFTREFLNSVIKVYMEYKRDVRNSTSGDTYSSINTQIAKHETDLKNLQDKMLSYQQTNNVAAAEEQVKAASTYLTQLLAEYSELKVEYQLLEATANQPPISQSALTNLLSQVPDPKNLSGNRLPKATPPPEFLGAQQELEKIRITRTRLSRYLRPKHPKILKLDEEIQRAEKLVEYFSQQSREQLDNSRQTAKVKIEQIQLTIKEWEEKVKEASTRIAAYERMRLDVDRMQKLHDSLLSLLQTVDVSRNLDQEGLTILDQASEPKEAKKGLDIVIPIALLLGIGGGLCLVFLVGYIDDSVLSLEELTTRFDEWIIGQVPETIKERKKSTPALLDIDDKRHIYAESFRNLRSALLFSPRKQEQPKTILVTSAIPNEGKSTVAANLARAIAFSGKQVLLVDADMRRGVLHERLGLNQEPGLSEMLTQGGELSEYVQSSSIPNLSVLTCGKEPINSGELILSSKCDRLLAQAQEQYDSVIIDSIPIFAADDTTSLAPKIDAVLFVVRSAYTSTRTVRRALQLLYERHVNVAGIIYNRANTNSKSYEYYKYAEYYRKHK